MAGRCELFQNFLGGLSGVSHGGSQAEWGPLTTVALRITALQAML